MQVLHLLGESGNTAAVGAAFKTFTGAKHPRIVSVHRWLTADIITVQLTADVFVIILQKRSL